LVSETYIDLIFHYRNTDTKRIYWSFDRTRNTRSLVFTWVVRQWPSGAFVRPRV